MTANPFAALLAGVKKYALNINTQRMEEHWLGKFVEIDDVLAALAAAVLDDLAEAGKVQAEANELIDFLSGQANLDGMGFGDPNEKGHRFWWRKYLSRFEAMDSLITALLARIAAQEAQIKGLEAEVAEVTSDRAYIIGANAGWEAAVEQGEATPAAAAMLARAEAAETSLAAMTKERDELRASITWVDEVYPERIEAGGAGIQITWGEFNAMQAAIGVTVDKRIGGPEGKAVHNHRLRSALAAERAKVAKLVEALTLAANRLSRRAVEYVPGGRLFIETWEWADEARAAITEAGQ